MQPTFIKDPEATLDYMFDWTDWLPDFVGINDAVITADAGLVVKSQSHTETTATAIVSGGVAGNQYKLSCKITAGALTDERSMIIRVEHR